MFVYCCLKHRISKTTCPWTEEIPMSNNVSHRNTLTGFSAGFFISTVWTLVKWLKVLDLILLWLYYHLRLHGLLCHHCYGDLALHWNHTFFKNHLQYLGSFTKILLLLGLHTSLKTGSYPDTDDGSSGCRKDNLQCPQWKLPIVKTRFFVLYITKGVQICI